MPITRPVAFQVIRQLTDLLEECNDERLERPDNVYLNHLLSVHAACVACGIHKRLAAPVAN